MLRRVLSSSLWPALLTLVAIAGLLYALGLPARSLVMHLAHLGLVVSLPGVFTWRALLSRLHREERPPTWFEDLTLGTIFGFTVHLPVYLAGVATGVPLLPLALPVLVAIASLTRWGRRTWALPTGSLHPAAAWAMALPALYGVLWLTRNTLLFRPLGIPAFRSPNVDETFHQALIAELSHRSPPEIPFLLGVRLDYHWFTHAHAAATMHATGLESTELLRLVLPVLVLVLGMLGLGAVALRLTGRASVAWVAPALMVLGAYHLFGPDFAADMFYEPYLGWRFLNSPSQAYGVMIAMPALMLILEVLRPGQRPRAALWIALTVALLGLSGAKATFLPVFVCGAIGAWTIHLLRTRRVDRSLTLLTVILVAVLVFAQTVIFGGQAGALDISYWETVEMALKRNQLAETDEHYILMTLAMLTAWLLYGVGAVGLRHRVLDPRTVWLVVAVVAGVTVPFVLFRTGLSQLWFSRATAPLVVLASVWGLSHLLPRRVQPRRTWVYAGLAGLAAAGAAVANVRGDTDGLDPATTSTLYATVLTPVVLGLVFVVLRALSRVTPLPRPPAVLLVAVILGLGASHVFVQAHQVLTGKGLTAPLPASAFPPTFAHGGAQAAHHVAEHAPVDAVVATNAHCYQPGKRVCDNRHFWIAAQTERRILIEGWGYNAVTNAGFDKDLPNSRLPAPFPDRLALNDAMFTEPSRAVLDRLVDEYDVSWLFVSREYDADPAALKAFAERTGAITEEYTNANYVVYRVTG